MSQKPRIFMTDKANQAKVKELESRCRLVAERVTESVRVLDHDPSLALYRLQEHVGRTIPNLVQRKILLSQQAQVQSGVMFDLENALSTVEQMKTSSDTFDNCLDMLRTCMKLDISQGRKPQDQTAIKARSKSLHDVARNRPE